MAFGLFRKSPEAKGELKSYDPSRVLEMVKGDGEFEKLMKEYVSKFEISSGYRSAGSPDKSSTLELNNLEGRIKNILQAKGISLEISPGKYGADESFSNLVQEYKEINEGFEGYREAA